MISAVVLAAGEAKRMGEPKLLLPWDRTTIIARVLDHVLASAVDEVVVVLGHEEEKVAGAIAGRPVRTVINQDYTKGMGTSIAAGLRAVSPGAAGFLLMLGDQPQVNSQTINRLIEEFKRTGRGIVVPVYRGRRGNPVILAAGYKEELLALQEDTGGREIVASHPEDVREVAVDSPGVVTDIDTPEDYRSIGRDTDTPK